MIQNAQWAELRVEGAWSEVGGSHPLLILTSPVYFKIRARNQQRDIGNEGKPEPPVLPTLNFWAGPLGQIPGTVDYSGFARMYQRDYPTWKVLQVP